MSEGKESKTDRTRSIRETDRSELKRRAGEWAVDRFVEDGMIIGLGHGSTAAFAVARIATRLREGRLKSILAIPCSTEVAQAAERLGIPLTTLDRHPKIDLTIDGADEVDPDLNLIKGGGGALLREKIVASASEREIIVIDAAKLSPSLGILFPLPVEVIPFAATLERKYLESLGAKVKLRGEDQPFVTDQGNFILDASFGPIADPAELARPLDARPGIVGHGLFLGLATDLVVGREDGVSHFTKEDAPIGSFTG